MLPLLLIALAACPAVAAAAPRPGTLDRSFGGDGRIAIRLPGERMRPAALAVQPDGKLLVAGGARDGEALVVRFLDNGRFDPSFGTAGVARVAFGLPVAVRGVAPQPDGRILLAGTATPEPGRERGAVMRLLADGSADPSFGAAGLATVDADHPSQQPVHFLRELAVLPDGRILAAGETRASDVHSLADLIVARFLPDGALDPAFDGNGSVSPPGAHRSTALVLRPDGSAVALGWSDVGIDGGGYFAIDLANPHDVRQYTYDDSVVGAGATVEPDGTILLAGELNDALLSWIRIGPDRRAVERGRAGAEGVEFAAFDARGLLMTAGLAGSPGGGTPIVLHRYTGRFRLDRSFGHRGIRQLRVGRPVTPIGAVLSGSRLVVGSTSETYGAFAEQTLYLHGVHANYDGAGPIVRFRGLPTRRCVRGTRRPLVRISDESRVRVEVRIDRRVIHETRRKRFRVAVDAGSLSPGVHRFVVRARDAAGHLGGRSATFSVCG